VVVQHSPAREGGGVGGDGARGNGSGKGAAAVRVLDGILIKIWI
jgi:hypothetical protein